MSVYCCKSIYRYRLSPETFGYALVIVQNVQAELRSQRVLHVSKLQTS